MTARCRCGAEVTKAEIRVVQRCARGHWASSTVAPAAIDTATVEPRPMTPGQRRAFHGKTGQLDKLLGQKAGTAKREFLGRVGLDSTAGLSETEASDLLDEIERELAAAR